MFSGKYNHLHPWKFLLSFYSGKYILFISSLNSLIHCLTVTDSFNFYTEPNRFSGQRNLQIIVIHLFYAGFLPDTTGFCSRPGALAGGHRRYYHGQFQ